MSLEDIVQVTITSDGRGVSRKSFGIPMVAGRHDAFGDLARSYKLATALQDLVTDGIPTTSPIYRGVAALARNTPKPLDVIVGKLITAFDHLFELTIPTGTPEVGTVYSMSVTSPLGVITPISYTSVALDDQDDVATALALLLTALPDLTAAPPGANVIACVADNSDEMWLIDGLDVSLIQFEDTTVDTSLATELGNILTANGDWYELTLADPQSKARITVAANWIESQERIFGATTHDAAVLDPASNTDVAYALNALTLFRTFLIYSGDQGGQAAATCAGNRLPTDPGASTWAFKPLSGVAFDKISANALTALTAKACNWYEKIAGAAITQQGKMVGGEWIDVVRGRDWLTVRLRERIFGLLINAPKVPFTNAGIDQVLIQVDAQLKEGINAGYLSPDPITGVEGDPPFFVTGPDVADVSAQDKAARTLPDVAFEAGLAGAIHVIKIAGTIKV